ncbi:MAG: GSCFA domain-containing protein [Paramuribaculum sp.]|nr:GSCFA domain-containing protein [Paramuribaculum sp.]
MTEFRTPVAPLTLNGLISHSTPLLMLGSCFASNIGTRLQRDLFDVCVNPFGTLYNPASISVACARLASGSEFTAEDVAERDGRLHSWHCHSSLSSDNLDMRQYLDKLNSNLAAARESVKNVSVAVLTLGTRRIYRLKETEMIVANCHKFPAADFVVENLDVAKSFECIVKAVAALRTINPDMKIVLTVSPVRYVGEGLHNSTVSKSVLMLACESACNTLRNLVYFPAYEIMMDDLRDYRFYAADMKHPSDVAVDYIYSIFSQSFFDKATVELSEKCRRLSARLAHRPLSGEPDAAFTGKTREMAQALAAEYPQLKPIVNKIINQ